MDKRTFIGIVLIIIITLMMPFYQRWIMGDRPPQPRKSPVAVQDSLPAASDTTQISQAPVTAQADTHMVAEEKQAAQAVNVPIQSAPEVKHLIIENKYIRAKWSTEQGGNPVYWELKHYGYYKGGNVNLIDHNGLALTFMNKDGKEIDLNQFNMFADFADGQTINLEESGDSVYVFQFYLPVQDGKIVKTIRFYPDKYSVDVEVVFDNLQNYVINRKYGILWKNGLPPTEENIHDDLSYSRAFVYMAEELEGFDANDKYREESFKGRVDWVAVRTKYFLSAIVPGVPEHTIGATLGGVKTKENGQEHKRFLAALEAEYQPVARYSDRFTVYLGPLDYYIIKKYGVNLQVLVMNKDWYERLFRPISLIIIPAFKFLYRFIPNYGFVIIVFSILIKLILYPLTKKSYQSMSEMQYLQPKMNELREKYKNDPQRLNREMMKLYKEHGVNPLGGCLPTLLQMPLLFALFIVFRSTIQLRGQPFIGWITDLSRPDKLPLGVHLPLLGDNIHVLPILMGLTMIWQSKISMTDPKQKMMVYFMPIFMIFIFYSLPSGLNLYYAVFNLLSMIQTHYIKKKMHPNGQPPVAQKAATPARKTKREKPSRKK